MKENNKTKGGDMKRRSEDPKLRKQQMVAVIVEFYGYGNNPWTWEQAQEAVRRQPGRTLFMRSPVEHKVDTEMKMKDSRMEF